VAGFSQKALLLLGRYAVRLRTMKVESLDHIHIYSADPQESAAFYRRHFGATEVLRNQNIHGQTRIFLSLGGDLVVLGPFPPDIAASEPPAPGDGAYSHGFGVAHLGLRVRNVEAAVRELKDAGVTILNEPLEEPTGLIYAYIAAPDGVIVELTQYGSSA
jgi:catechol 2,3-dioxygenase-like lactoylglutathione lyase family enzyme